MKKLTILLFSILISFNSYGKWLEIDKTMHEILSIPGAEIISAVSSGKRIGDMVYIIKIYRSKRTSLPLYKCVDLPNDNVLTCWWLVEGKQW
jgi:hypothetical protein